MEDAAKDYAAGVAAGLATVAVGHPFDTVKVNLQARSDGGTRIGGLHCAHWIIRREGLRGLYKGATSSFLGMAVESSLLFGIYAQMKAALEGGDVVDSPKLSSIVPSAAIGGAIISLVLCPTELVKCRLQVQEKTAVVTGYSGPLDCARKTLQTAGVQGLFRGWPATLCREAVGNVCFFSTYETSRHLMLSYLDRKDSPVPRTVLEAVVAIVSGGISGMAFWTAVLPFDVAKTRIQTAASLRGRKSMGLEMKLMYKELGIRGLYTGFAPTLLRAFPANAAAIVSWELAAKILGGRKLQTLEGPLA